MTQWLGCITGRWYRSHPAVARTDDKEVVPIACDAKWAAATHGLRPTEVSASAEDQNRGERMRRERDWSLGVRRLSAPRSLT